MNAPSAIKVFIRNLTGEYLSCDGEQWSFTPDRAQAHSFDYHADEVAGQLEQVQRDHGVVWVAVHVDPQLAGETCDACGRKLLSLEAIFDGTRFLCPACRSPGIRNTGR